MTPAPSPVDDVRVCEPSTGPGSPLPQAWIDDEDGNRDALRKLVAPGRFLLVAGEEGDAWYADARGLAADADVPVDAVRIGHLDGDRFDPRCPWLRHRGIGSDGAVLVRPDRFVAWRAPAASEVPRRALAEAFSQILARPPSTQRCPSPPAPPEDQAGSGASHGTFPETQCVRRAASLPRCRCRGGVAKVA